jgi:hypothetical protein
MAVKKHNFKIGEGIAMAKPFKWTYQGKALTA